MRLKHVSRTVPSGRDSPPAGFQPCSHDVATGFWAMSQQTRPRVIFTSRHLIPAVKKDVLSASKFSNIIYEFKCRCDARYVGRTTRTLTDRIKQHVPLSFRKNTIGPWIQWVRACRKVPASIPTSCASAIGQHFIENANSAEHFNVDVFKILMLIISMVMEHIQIQLVIILYCKYSTAQ